MTNDDLSAFDDGTVLDVVIVDAAATDDGGCTVEVAISTGPLKGELVELRSPNLDLDPLDLLGLLATVTVVDGEPRLSL